MSTFRSNKLLLRKTNFLLALLFSFTQLTNPIQCYSPLSAFTSDNHNQQSGHASSSHSIDISNDVIEPPESGGSGGPILVAVAPSTPLEVAESSISNSMLLPLLSNKPSINSAPTAIIMKEGESIVDNDSNNSNSLNTSQSVVLAELWTKINSTQSPKSDKTRVIEMFNKFFIKARSHDDQQQKEYVRDGVILRLRELGFETSFLQKSRFEFRRRPAFSYNMISILPGKYRQTKRDKIVLIGAHWDSATKAPGVDDNGSGSTCLLEIARLISENRCSFEHTVMLVWFDYEEQGKYGSEFFVNDYLFPLELEKYGSKFIGAYILDMILVRDKENNSQSIPSNLKTRLKEFSDELEREKFCGDFLATWSRKTWDEPLENAFKLSWQDLGYESRTFKAMRPELPQARLPNAEERYEWKDFFRSDHASFWFPPLTSSAVRRSPNRTSTATHSSLNAILLTDLGPWRKSYSKCYHSACDDEHLLTDGNLAFMQQVIDSLVLTLMRVGHGECKAMPAPVVQPAVALPPSPPPPVTTTTSSTTQAPEERPVSVDITMSTTTTEIPRIDINAAVNISAAASSTSIANCSAIVDAALNQTTSASNLTMSAANDQSVKPLACISSAQAH